MERVAGGSGRAGPAGPIPGRSWLKTAVGEATMNAMEHGNHYDPDLPVAIRLLTTRPSELIGQHHRPRRRPTDTGRRTCP